MRFGWSLALLIALLAGCFDSAPGPSTQSPLPRLVDFTACDFHYPDESKVPCQNQATRLQVSGTEAPMGWVCARQSAEPYSYFKIYWNPVQDRYGVRFDYHDPQTVPGSTGGLVLLEANDESRRLLGLYDWDHSSTQGFFVLPPEAGSGLYVVLRVYQMVYESNTTLLQNGTLRGLWSAYKSADPDTWLIFELQAEGRSYFFEKMAPIPFGGKVFYVPRVGVLNITGADFDMRIRFNASGPQGFPLDRVTVPCEAKGLVLD